MARKQKTIHYIYKTTCLVTDRYYIGMHSTNNIDDGYMGSGKRLRRSIRKHGEDNHKREILEYYKTRELLVEAEIKAITPDMIGDNDCMNLIGGGDGGYISEEHYKITSKIGGGIHTKRMKEDKEYREQTKKNLVRGHQKSMKNGSYKGMQNFKGKTHSDETKKLISEVRKGTGTGKSNSQYGTCWVTNGNEVKKIKKEDLESFIKDGWRRGRK